VRSNASLLLLAFVPPLAAFEYGGVSHVEHSGDGPNAKPLFS